MKKGFAIFDLDYTLLPFDTLLLLSNRTIKKQPWRIFYLFVFLSAAPLALLHLIGSRGIKRLFLSFLFRMRADEVRKLAQEFATELLPLIHPELRLEIERHRTEGRCLVLTTASCDFYVEPLGRLLGFDEIRSTPMEIPERMPLLVKIPGRNNKGSVKVDNMAGLFGPEIGARILASPDRAWLKIPDSHSYSDSPADFPILRLAEKATLIDPVSGKLIAEGHKTGWTVILPKRRSPKGFARLWEMFRQMTGLYSA